MVVSEVYKWLQGPLGSVVMVCFATPGGGLGAGGVRGNIKEWEAVLPRMCVADICTNLIITIVSHTKPDMCSVSFSV